MSSIPFVDLAAQRAAIESDVSEAVAACFRRNDWILGRDVAAFEEEFAGYCEATAAVGTDSGLSALELILRAFDIGPGDEVVTAANTFVATALAISAAGATPRLVDVDPSTSNIDATLLEAAITPSTRAIMPVHLYGQPADMDAILEVARKHDLVVVEDACQAHGARYKGRRAGSLGDAAAFSFYPSKNLGAYGDGGGATTSDPDVLERLRLLRNYGQREKYIHVVEGYNRRLDTLQAAALRVKLRHLDGWNDARRRHAVLYTALFREHGIEAPVAREWAEHVWHLYVLHVDDRDSLRALLSEQGIESGIHYPLPIHLQPAFEHLGYARGDFPVTESLAERAISLPMFAELEETQIRTVVSAVAGFVERTGAETGPGVHATDSPLGKT